MKIKRNRKHIGRRVIVCNPQMLLDGAVGIIKGFRGDMRAGIPWVKVWFDRTGNVETVAASNLKFAD